MNAGVEIFLVIPEFSSLQYVFFTMAVRRVFLNLFESGDPSLVVEGDAVKDHDIESPTRARHEQVIQL